MGRLMNGDLPILGVLITAVAGCYGWIIKHVSNNRKHPSSDHIVYRDTCQANRDCLETEIKALRECVELKFEQLTEGQKEIKELIQKKE